jgi:mannose-6-phosphate isomerase-like protein (cupin superfamily)
MDRDQVGGDRGDVRARNGRYEVVAAGEASAPFLDVHRSTHVGHDARVDDAAVIRPGTRRRMVGVEGGEDPVDGLTIEAGVVPGSEFETVTYPTDEILLRAVGRGDVQVAEYRSVDRDGPPAHSHEWDEVEVVIEGEVEFLVGDRWTRGGPGTVQLLPRGTPHSVRVPAGEARVLMVTIGAPYDGFARDVARLMSGPYEAADLVEVAGRHGVWLA